MYSGGLKKVGGCCRVDRWYKGGGALAGWNDVVEEAFRIEDVSANGKETLTGYHIYNTYFYRYS